MSELLSKCVHCGLPRSRHLTAMKYCDTNQTHMFSPKTPVSEPAIKGYPAISSIPSNAGSMAGDTRCENCRQSVHNHIDSMCFPAKAAPEPSGKGVLTNGKIGSISDLVTITEPPKVAPDSEDEAFRIASNSFRAALVPLIVSQDEIDAFTEGWNARARLDADPVVIANTSTDANLKPRIIKLLEGRPDIVFSLPSIASMLGANVNSVSPYLSDMCKSGKIERRSRGMYGARLDAERGK